MHKQRYTTYLMINLPKRSKKSPESNKKADKLVTMYRNMNARNGEETLKEVIDNIELEAGVPVRAGGA